MIVIKMVDSKNITCIEEEQYIKRVYNSFAFVCVIDTFFAILFYISIIKDITFLYWLSLILMILSLVPLIGGLHLIYSYNKK